MLTWIIQSVLPAFIVAMFPLCWYQWHKTATRLKTEPEEVQLLLQNIEIKAKTVARYENKLDEALLFCRKYWGPKISFQALGFSMVLALFYSLFVFVGTWTINGQGVIGNTTFLSELEDGIERVGFTFTIMVAYVLIFFGIVFSDEIEEKFLYFVSNALNLSEESKIQKRLFCGAGCMFVFIIFLLPPYIFMDRLRGYELFLIVGLSAPFFATILSGFHFPGIVPILVVMSIIAIFPAYASLIFDRPVPASVAIISVGGVFAAFWRGVWKGVIRGDKRAQRISVGVTGAIGGFFVGYLASAAGDFSKVFENEAIIAIMLFLILLPLINGFWDFVSMSFSRWFGEMLSRKLKERREGSKREGTKERYGWRYVVYFTCFDAVIAIFLLISIAWVLRFVVDLYNRSAELAGGKPPLILDTFLSRVVESPLGPEGFWLTFMLFSTLLPTFAHLGAVLFTSISVQHPGLVDVQEYRKAIVSSDPNGRRRAIRNLTGLSTAYFIMRSATGFVGLAICLIVISEFFNWFTGVSLAKGLNEFVKATSPF